MRYLNGYDFGGGPINDGDSSLGGSGEYFVAGSTLPGFNEHLMLFNPSNYQVTADIFWNADGEQDRERSSGPRRRAT